MQLNINIVIYEINHFPEGIIPLGINNVYIRLIFVLLQ